MFTSPKFIAGVLSGVAIGAAGSVFLLFSDKEKGLDLRKKIATAVRDMAEKTIERLEDLEKTVEELESKVEGDESSSKSARKRHKVEEPASN